MTMQVTINGYQFNNIYRMAKEVAWARMRVAPWKELQQERRAQGKSLTKKQVAEFDEECRDWRITEGMAEMMCKALNIDLERLVASVNRMMGNGYFTWNDMDEEQQERFLEMVQE